MRNVPSLETVQRDYAPKGVQFYYIYKTLAHPELRGYLAPFTLQERLMHIQEAKKRLGSRIEWISDTMSNDLKHALGDAQNSEFIIDPNGRVLKRRPWSNPAELRKSLAEIVGPVAKPTKVSDLKMKFALDRPSGKIPTGIVPKIQIPSRMVPLKITPAKQKRNVPFYAKLRAEVDRPFLTEGKGKLYLGFHLDPLYAIHWNNLTKPLEFELECPQGVTVTPRRGSAPRVKEPADKDPREFLLDITSSTKGRPLNLTVRYFACDDADTFCIPVTQRYAVYLEQDPDGGSARRSSRLSGGRFDFRARLRDMDRNQDGKLALDEVPERLRRRFLVLDSNGDDFVDEQELQAFARQRGSTPGSASEFIQRVLHNDTDGDGRISRQEAPRPMRDRFDRMDTDRDGFVDEEELRAAARRFYGDPP